MVLLDLLRDRFADPEELREITGGPVLATVTQFARTSFAGRARAGAAAEPPPPETSAARGEAGLDKAGS